MESKTLLLLILFSIKHILGDFVLQSTNMAIGKGKKDWSFTGALSSHCLVHVLLSFPIILFLLDLRYMWFLGVEFVAHFAIDRLKSGPRYGGRFTMNKNPKAFWVSFGIDQFLHHMTYVLFIFVSV